MSNLSARGLQVPITVITRRVRGAVVCQLCVCVRAIDWIRGSGALLPVRNTTQQVLKPLIIWSCGYYIRPRQLITPSLSNIQQLSPQTNKIWEFDDLVQILLTN
jgi:hypothetical protein